MVVIVDAPSMTEPAKIWYFLFPNPSLAWTAKKSHKLWYQKGQISFFLFWAQTLIRTYGEKMPTSGNLNGGFRHFPKRFRKLICLVSILTCELPALQHWYYADPWLIQDDVLGRGRACMFVIWYTTLTHCLWPVLQRFQVFSAWNEWAVTELLSNSSLNVMNRGRIGRSSQYFQIRGFKGAWSQMEDDSRCWAVCWGLGSYTTQDASGNDFVGWRFVLVEVLYR